LEHLSVVVEGGVGRVVLHRPPANALNLDLIDELGLAADVLATDVAVRAVVLASDVPGFFMAGADLEMVEANWHRIAEVSAVLRSSLGRWERLPQPTVAVIAGHALGGGCELALTCDFRVMARGKARIGLPEVQRGLLPAGGGTQRVARLLGRGRALDLCLRGRALDADEAERIGLITRACEPSDVDAAGNAVAHEFIDLAPMTLAAIKHTILDGLDMALEPALSLESDALTRLAATEDAREGVRSFLERRPPRFEGR
jgi:enoyl-CoA hydratase